MKIMPFGLSDVGRKRTHNEDAFLVNEDINLYIVADGMGGHSGGELASRLSTQTIEEVIRSITSDPEATVIDGVNTEEAEPGDQLRYALETASKKIFDRAKFDTSLRGMGTTTVAALFKNGKVHIANVGDSRVYMVRNNKISQVTTDHSLVNEQVKAGLISQTDAKSHKLKNIITRSLGYTEEVEIDVHSIDVGIGDKFLLCTDGLSNMLDDSSIEKIISDLPLKESCYKLVEKANEVGGEDNVTVLLLVVVDPAG